jgi:1-deoxy-D-xylulose-5-phosphate reductoisomerase
MKRLAILGSTGSIGVNTLDVVARRRGEFEVFSLAAGSNWPRLLEQTLAFRPKLVSVESEASRASLLEALGGSGLAKDQWPQVGCGPQSRVEAAIAPEVDCVVSAIVGVAGLEATYEAACRGKRIALANKETLVASGRLVMEAARTAGAEVIPVDSEHNGAHQCLRGARRSEVARLILTASGGPFRNTPREKLAGVSPEQALAHPTWKMGPRITIDSATMMNKGFEVIEACWLFGFSPSEVDVAIHPQSKVHAMVEFVDGSVVAQISATDMRMPIQYALTYPERAEAPVPRLDWTQPMALEFFPPDLDKFPLLGLAYQAQRDGGSAACTLNAADEVAVEAFLNGQIAFPEMAAVVEETLSALPAREPSSIGEVLAIDRESRRRARELAAARVAPQGLHA